MRGSTTVFRLLLLLVLLTVGTTAAACASDSGTDVEEDVAAQDVDEAECGAAYVDFVTIQPDGDGAFFAIVQGHYPAACDSLGTVSQLVDGDTIAITMCSTRPEGEACADMLTPFTETIPIETDELEPGEYIVAINGKAEDANIEPSTLTID